MATREPIPREARQEGKGKAKIEAASEMNSANREVLERFPLRLAAQKSSSGRKTVECATFARKTHVFRYRPNRCNLRERSESVAICAPLNQHG